MPFSIPVIAQLACTLEATAPKLGNVHPAAAFEDLSHLDFLLAAAALAETLQQTGGQPIGERVHDAVLRAAGVTRSNANLGMILLIVPLAAAAEAGDLTSEGVRGELNKRTAADAQTLYAAIRAANPGGMGQVEEHDLADAPPSDVLVAMGAAAKRDRIARQWVTGMEDLFESVVPLLVQNTRHRGDVLRAISDTHVQLLSMWPDSLVARKHGADAAWALQREAQELWSRRDAPDYDRLYQQCDRRLRGGTRRVNPGTTADLIAGGLFIALLKNQIEVSRNA